MIECQFKHTYNCVSRIMLAQLGDASNALGRAPGF